MKKVLAIALGLLVMLMAISIASFAQDQTPRVDQRQQNQRLRIRAGLATGDLTRREAARLLAALMYIRRGECYAKADGNVTKSERFRLHRMQRRASLQIYRERHDRRNRLQ